MNRKALRVFVAIVTAVMLSALIQLLIGSRELNQWVVAVLTIAVPVMLGGFVAKLVAGGE